MWETDKQSQTEPLLLIIKANLLQTWRRILSLKQQSRLLTLFILFFVGGYLWFSFWLFYKGLLFISRFPGLGGLLTERLLFLLFAFLFLMLWFSNLVISYTNLFRNRETAFLLPLPIPAQVVFQWKFIESTLLASWAFLFLVAPLLVAYGLTCRVSWHFYGITILLLFLFIILPAVGGSWCAVILARYLDRRNFQVWAIISMALLVLLAGLAIQPPPITDDTLETRVLEVLDRLLYRTRFAQFVWLPSYWLSASVMHWSEGSLATATFFGMVLMSNALFFGFLALKGTGPAFYEAYSAVQSRGQLLAVWKNRLQKWQHSEQPYRPGLLERIIHFVPGIGPDVKAIMIKDMRSFWRDTSQWGQTLVLFGLLGVYIINLRHFSRQLNNSFWISLVSHLNLLACSLNLATLTTRFVFPQFSQEGKRVWIIGMAPLGLAKVMRAKFWLSSIVSWGITCSLMYISCRMLKMPWQLTLHYMAAVSVMAVTLSAMAIGLGTLYPNLKEDHPGKIVSGFGGTFCLVLSFLYIVGAIAIMASGAYWGRWRPRFYQTQWLSWIGFVLWSVVLGWFPYRFGLQKLRKWEI